MHDDDIKNVDDNLVEDEKDDSLESEGNSLDNVQQAEQEVNEEKEVALQSDFFDEDDPRNLAEEVVEAQMGEAVKDDDDFGFYDEVEEDFISASGVSADEQDLSEEAPEENSRSLDFKEELGLTAKIEAIIFASPKTIKLAEITGLLELDLDQKTILEHIQNLQREYEERGGGFQLVHLAGQGYQFQTVKAASSLMEKMFSSRPRPISRAAQETLAIIAYRQPCTRADIEFIRGVDAGSIIKNLLERDLIKCVGRKEDAGRPMLFATTDEFLRVYRLNGLADMPPLESFQPSQDMIRGAMESLSGQAPVDVEVFIDDQDKSERTIEGAVAGDPDEELFVSEQPDEESFEKTSETSSAGEELPTESSLEPDQRSPSQEEKENETHAADASTEMDLPVGDHLPPSSRDLDH